MLTFLLLVNVVYGGHELILYPSFYPHELRFFRVENAEDASQLIAQTSTTGTVKGLHLYLAPLKPAAKRLNNTKINFIQEVDRLYYLVINLDKRPWNNSAVADLLMNSISRDSVAAKLNGQPVYLPILSYQGDYIYVADISESLRMKSFSIDSSELRKLKITAIKLSVQEVEEEAVEAVASELGKLGNVSVVKDGADDWDFKLSSISLNNFFQKNTVWANGIYFDLDAYQGYSLAAAIYRQSVNMSSEPQSIYNKILYGRYSNEFEKMLLVRQLVRWGIKHGGIIPLFITYRHYMFNDDWDEGIYNMAVNPLTGISTDVFYRTVKLKLFPWNGWLLIGHNDTEDCSYNPFMFEKTLYCRAILMLVSDSAFIHQPYNGSWEVNRVVWYAVEKGGVKVPEDSYIFTDRKAAAADSRVLYRVLLGKFHHGAEMRLADILYSYHFLKKHINQFPPAVQERVNRLVALRLLNTTESVIPLAGLNLTKRDMWLELYLNYTHPDDVKVAAFLPPWTMLPWELLSLADTAVSTGKTISSINLVKDPQLPALFKELKNVNHVPDFLSKFVTQEEAKHRWELLDGWFSQHGHLLVTNGPYYLDSDNSSTKILKAFRSPAYPLGVGSYDYLSVPRFSKIIGVEPRSIRLVRGENVSVNVRVAVEQVEQAPRGYKSFGYIPSHEALVYAYLRDGDGNVLWLGKARPLSEKGLFNAVIDADVVRRLADGNYTFHFTVVPTYKYYSWPSAVNAMNPAHSSVSIMVSGKTDSAEAGAQKETYITYVVLISGVVVLAFLALRKSKRFNKVLHTSGQTQAHR